MAENKGPGLFTMGLGGIVTDASVLNTEFLKNLRDIAKSRADLLELDNWKEALTELSNASDKVLQLVQQAKADAGE